MCAGAILHARIARLVYAAPDPKAGACGSVLSVMNHPQLNHKVEVTSGLLAEECGALLTNFFRSPPLEQTPAAHPHLTSGSTGGASMATKKWSAKVNTDSTHPDQGLFNKDASTIAKALASKKVSPKGPASGMRMLNFYINRAGKNLSASRQTELEKAKTLLSEIIAKQKGNSSGSRRSKIRQRLKGSERQPRRLPQRRQRNPAENLPQRNNQSQKAL